MSLRKNLVQFASHVLRRNDLDVSKIQSITFNFSDYVHYNSVGRVDVVVECDNDDTQTIKVDDNFYKPITAAKRGFVSISIKPLVVDEPVATFGMKWPEKMK